MTIYYLLKYDLLDLRKELVLLPAWIVGLVVGNGVNIVFGY